MALDFPWQAFLKAQQERDRSQQSDVENIAGIGKGLGEGLGAIGQQMQAQKKKEAWGRTINSMMQDPNTSPGLKQILPLIAQDPNAAGQLLPGLLRPEGQPTTIYYDQKTGRYSPVPGPGLIPVPTTTKEAGNLLKTSVGRQFAPPRPIVPKPVNPADAAKLGVKVQEDNIKNRSWVQVLKDAFSGNSPQVQNPLSPQQPSPQQGKVPKVTNVQVTQ